MSARLGKATLQLGPTAIKRVDQGVVIVERGEVGFLVMFPTGDIESARTEKAAERRIKAWMARDLHAREKKTGANVGIARIEWRL